MFTSVASKFRQRFWLVVCDLCCVIFAAKKCLPPSVEGAEIITSGDEPQWKIGTHVRIDCTSEEDFIDGPSHSTCNENKRWTPALPECRTGKFH